MNTNHGQTYQTIAPAWVARAILIADEPTNVAFAKIGGRCWTTELPETSEFQNEKPACVITDVGSTQDPRANTLYIEGLMELRIFGGSRYLADCWKTWNAIRDRLINAAGTEITINELDCRARWLWATDEGTPREIRKHPATQWPELNCTLQYAVQGITKEI